MSRLSLLVLIALSSACVSPAPELLPLQQSAPPALSVTPLVPGQDVRFTVTGANPGERVGLGFSLLGLGSGPCIGGAGLLCLDILAPRQLGSTTANAAGTATLTVTLPSTVPAGTEASFQAVVLRGTSGAAWEKSNPISLTTQAIALTVPDMQPGDLIITEIMRNPSAVSDPRGEWFEIYNASGEDADLQGLRITDFGNDDATVQSHVFVPAGAYLVVGRDDDPTLNGGAPVDLVVPMALGNMIDELHLVANGTIIDTVAWDGGATFPAAPGASMSLDPAFAHAAGNDAGVHWCAGAAPYGLGDLGTPGAPNEACGWFAPEGAVTLVCSGADFQPPTIAAGADAFAVGCMREGNQNMRPELHVLDHDGTILGSQLNWDDADGYYYTPVTVDYHNGLFQRIYHYNCDSGDSLVPGWGGQCLDFQLVRPDGTAASTPVRMVESGNNVSSSLDYNGVGYGIAWISYDRTVARELNPAGQFMSGDGLSNSFLDPDPLTADGRHANRARLRWDGDSGEFVIATIFSGTLYIQRTSASWNIVDHITEVGPAFAGSSAGDLEMEIANREAYIVYSRSPSEGPWLVRLNEDNTVGAEIQLQDEVSLYPSLEVVGGEVYAFTDRAGQAWVHTLDRDLNLLRSEAIAGSELRPEARFGWDPTTGDAGMVWANGSEVWFQRVSVGGITP